MTTVASVAVAEPVLAVDGITKAFRSGPPWHRRRVEVLRGAALEVRPGELVGLVGENGSGKSTLMQVIVGLLAHLTTMKDAHGASMVTITVAFLAALCGVFIMRSAHSADRRLIVAGYRPIEAVIPRLTVLATATTVVLTVSLAVTALSWTPASWPAFILGNLLVGLTYACIGALAGSALGQLGATYVVLFLAMLGTGILQNPMFGDGTPGGLAYTFPDYAAGRIVIDGAFSPAFHAWTELALALGWLAALGLAVAWALRRLLRSTA